MFRARAPLQFAEQRAAQDEGASVIVSVQSSEDAITVRKMKMFLRRSTDVAWLPYYSTKVLKIVKPHLDNAGFTGDSLGEAAYFICPFIRRYLNLMEADKANHMRLREYAISNPGSPLETYNDNDAEDLYRSIVTPMQADVASLVFRPTHIRRLLKVLLKQERSAHIGPVLDVIFSHAALDPSMNMLCFGFLNLKMETRDNELLVSGKIRFAHFTIVGELMTDTLHWEPILLQQAEPGVADSTPDVPNLRRFVDTATDVPNVRRFVEQLPVHRRLKIPHLRKKKANNRMSGQSGGNVAEGVESN